MGISCRILAIVLPFVVVASGCQQTTDKEARSTLRGQPNVPIEEAKRTLAEFNKVEIKAPPRSTADILDQMEKAQDPSSEQRKRLIREATKVLPADATNHDILVSSFARSRAAGKLGWSGRNLADLRHTLDWIERYEKGEDVGFRIGGDFRHHVFRDAAWAEFYDGNFQKSAKLFQRAADIGYFGRSGRTDWPELSGLAMAYASSGDLNTANDMARYAKEANDDASETTGTIWSGAHRRNPWRQIYELSANASILEVQGKWLEAESPLRQAIKIYEDEFGNLTYQPYPHGRAAEWQDLQRAELARNLIAQGRYPEAEVVAREALSIALKENGKFAKTTAILLGVFVDLLMAEGRFEEADDLAAQILQIHDTLATPSDSRLRGATAFQRAETLALSGEGRSALRKYEAVRAAFVTNMETFDRFFASDPTYLLTTARFGPRDEAREAVRKALERSVTNRGPDHYDAAELLAMSAIVEARSGASKAALQKFRRSLDTMIEEDRKARASGRALPVKRKRLQIIVETYIDRLTNKRARTDGAVAEAFRLAGFAQGHTVEWALARALARRQAVDPALAALIRSEQDAEGQLEALYRLLNRALSNRDNAKSSAAAQLRGQILTLERSRAAVRREIEDQFPEYASLINPPPMTIEAARGFLKLGESLISFFVGEEQTYVWAIPFAGPVAFHVAAVGREHIEHDVAALRRALDPDPVTLADIPPFSVELAHDLFKTLLAPVEGGWKKSSSLIVVPHGSLAQLPLAVLPVTPARIREDVGLLFEEYRTVPWLARSHAISTMPSVASLRALRRPAEKASTDRRFVGFGDPVFASRQSARAPIEMVARIRGKPVRFRAPVLVRKANRADLDSLPRLPDTATELRAVANALKAPLDGSVFLGRQASEANVKSLDLSRTQIISFATHGLVPGDLDGLEQPALALSSPSVTGDKEDGLLTMEEITALRLNADWIVLSACNTAAASGEGAEAVSGLGRAFFYAGARALLVSNWPVHSAATAELMTSVFSLYSQNSNVQRDKALRNALTTMIDKGVYRPEGSAKPLFSYAHPIFWAPFTLVGDGKSERAVN